MKVIRALGRGEEADLGGGTVVRFPWIKPGAEVPVWMAAYGPKALRMTGEEADGFILQLADLYLTEYMVKAVKDAAVAAGAGPVRGDRVAAPAYVTADDSPEALAHAREQCRWFGGMVGNHVADLVEEYWRPLPPPYPANSPTTSRPARATTTPTTGAAATRTPGSCRTRSSTGSAPDRAGREAHREAERPARPRRRPVRALRHARRAGSRDRRVRHQGDPGRQRLSPLTTSPFPLGKGGPGRTRAPLGTARTAFSRPTARLACP